MKKQLALIPIAALSLSAGAAALIGISQGAATAHTAPAAISAPMRTQLLGPVSVPAGVGQVLFEEDPVSTPASTPKNNPAPAQPSPIVTSAPTTTTAAPPVSTGTATTTPVTTPPQWQTTSPDATGLATNPDQCVVNAQVPPSAAQLADQNGPQGFNETFPATCSDVPADEATFPAGTTFTVTQVS